MDGVDACDRIGVRKRMSELDFNDLFHIERNTVPSPGKTLIPISVIDEIPRGEHEETILLFRRHAGFEYVSVAVDELYRERLGVFIRSCVKTNDVFSFFQGKRRFKAFVDGKVLAVPDQPMGKTFVLLD